MHTFQINVLIHLFMSSTCFKHHVFIISENICTCSFIWYVLHAFMSAVYQVEGCAWKTYDKATY